MDKFEKVDGVAAPLPILNIDTDMIIPKQFLKTIKRTGLGVNLFDEMRYTKDGAEIPEFVLNQPAYRNAQILVAGDNSTSFADIFYNNCFKNGILPIALPQADVDKLMEDAERGANATVSVDLVSQEIHGPDGGVIKFEVDAFRKHCLLEGLDDVGLTLQKEASINAFEEKLAVSQPWA
jgi:3-isopropylmalate/(R)-2-methylmalate dehydratase small subunit